MRISMEKLYNELWTLLIYLAIFVNIKAISKPDVPKSVIIMGTIATMCLVVHLVSRVIEVDKNEEQTKL